ncbi:MAG: accessory factor UbiK family protein, partial [Rhodospirillaceae bacterium]|nr:accessory factor UbiK family protein [Rhodospirillaceae bacterium]MDE0254584.1 accessory factor UbiK family protein [Rhodospirillaceae bacterium]MDE0616923.1 accessory factor UbiK family protein [Rhodospirillaceae bacterium]
MQANNKLIDDFARVTTGMLGVAAGVRSEAEAMVKARLQGLLADMDLVTREEFDVARDMAAKARDGQEALEARLTELQQRLEKLEKPARGRRKGA